MMPSKIKKIERSRIFELLTGLNPEYDQVHIQIFGKELLPSLNYVYAYFQNEENRQSSMLPSSVSKKSAFVSEKPAQISIQFVISESGLSWWEGRGGGRTSSVPFDDKEKSKCEHYGQFHHTKEQCWDPHGRPPPQLPSGSSHSGRHEVDLVPVPVLLWLLVPLLLAKHQPQSTNMMVPISLKNWFEALCCFMAQLDSPSTSTSQFARSGTSALAYHASTSTPGPSQIIDSGATDHMIGMPFVFSTQHQCSGRDKVWGADENFSSICGKGIVVYFMIW